MALVKCSFCGKEYSSILNSCKFCKNRGLVISKEDLYEDSEEVNKNINWKNYTLGRIEHFFYTFLFWTVVFILELFTWIGNYDDSIAYLYYSFSAFFITWPRLRDTDLNYQSRHLVYVPFLWWPLKLHLFFKASKEESNNDKSNK